MMRDGKNRLLEELVLDDSSKAALEEVRERCLEELASAPEGREALLADLVADEVALEEVREACVGGGSGSRLWMAAAAAVAVLLAVVLMQDRGEEPVKITVVETEVEVSKPDLIQRTGETSLVRVSTKNMDLKLERIGGEEIPDGVAWVVVDGKRVAFMEGPDGLVRMTP